MYIIDKDDFEIADTTTMTIRVCQEVDSIVISSSVYTMTAANCMANEQVLDLIATYYDKHMSGSQVDATIISPHFCNTPILTWSMTSNPDLSSELNRPQFDSISNPTKIVTDDLNGSLTGGIYVHTVSATDSVSGVIATSVDISIEVIEVVVDTIVISPLPILRGQIAAVSHGGL